MAGMVLNVCIYVAKSFWITTIVYCAIEKAAKEYVKAKKEVIDYESGKKLFVNSERNRFN